MSIISLSKRALAIILCIVMVCEMSVGAFAQETECICVPAPVEGEAHQEDCPLYVAPETAPEDLSDEATAFIAAVIALDKNAILASFKAHRAATAAAAADPENAELAQVAEASGEAMDAATASIDAALALYGEVPLDELENEQVSAANDTLMGIVSATIPSFGGPMPSPLALVEFSGVADGIAEPGASFDAITGVTASDDSGSLDVVITTINSDDPGYTFTPGDTTIAVGNAGYTYTVTYDAYAPTDTLHTTSLGTATRTLTSYAYAIGLLTISGYDEIAAGDTSYNLLSDTSGTLTMNYTAPESRTHNTVLVLSTLEYGAEIETISGAFSGITVEQLDAHTVALRIPNDSNSVLALQVKLKTVNLTQTQAEKWMAEGSLNTKISAAEYSLDSSIPLRQVLIDGVQQQEVIYREVSVEAGTPQIDATHTYDFTVSSVPELTNTLLEQAGLYCSNNGYINGHTQNGMLRYDIPSPGQEVDGETAGLMQITGLKIYVPVKDGVFSSAADEKLELVGLGTTQTYNGYRYYGRDLDGADFDQIWDSWTIDPVATDPSGRSYYLVHPPTGTNWININANDLQSRFYGMRLIWKLKTGEALDYTDVTYTHYQAADTEVMYKVPDAPGAPAEQTATFTGPQVYTFARVDSPVYTHAYNPVRHEDNVPNNNVIIGSYHANEVYTYTTNTYYYADVLVTSGSPKIRTEYVPSDTVGPVTQTLDFPYAIQPTKLYLTDKYQGSDYRYTKDNSYDESKLSQVESLTYELWDGTVVTADADTIAAINAEFARQAKTAAEVNENPVHNTTYTFDLASATVDNPVKSVEVVWSALATEARYGYPWVAGVTNVERGTGANKTYSLSSGSYTVELSFDYRVGEYLDQAKTQPIVNFDMAQVKYNFTAEDNADPSASEKNEKYLWFRFKVPTCPDLYGTYQDATVNTLYPKYLDGIGTTQIGSVGFYIGQFGERKDNVENPVIDLSVQYHNDYEAAVMADSVRGDNRIKGITEAQGLAFLTGNFTATPKLSGWVIEYTTKDGNNGSATVPTITDPAGAPFQIPLASGDAFTSIKMHYDGTFDASHESETDTNTVMWLIQNIEIRLLNKNPFTGESIIITNDANESAIAGFIRLNGVLYIDNCSCEGQAHTNGQTMLVPVTNRGVSNAENRNPPEQYVYSTRKAILSFDGLRSMPAMQTIYQGDSVDDTFKLSASFGGQQRYSLFPSYSFSEDVLVGHFADVPWDISEAAYIELTDEQFAVDLSKTSYYGIPATDPAVESEFISAGGRRFLKLQFAQGYLRSTSYRINGNICGTAGAQWLTNPGYFRAYFSGENSNQVAGPIQIGFNTLPGVDACIHYPIGKIYLDFSQLLDKYDAPNVTGYDYNRTDYVFTNAVEDTLGLSSSAATEAKLFELDVAKDSDTPYKVNILKRVKLGADLIPGKNTNTFDFDTRTTAFNPDDKDDLNALVSLESNPSPGGPIYEMTTYVKIPRTAAPIIWKDGDGNEQTAISEYDMYLRGAPVVVTDSTGLSNNLHYAYTKDTNPGETSAYTFVPTTPDEWKQVTGIKIVADEMPPDSAVNLRLNLSTDAKTALGVQKAYSGGTDTYKESVEGESFKNILPLATWQYEDYLITPNAIVFWDIYDENGLRGTTGATGSATERGISGVKLDLYAPDGALLESTTTAADGTYQLHSYTREAGHKITITVGAGTKLTANSTSAITASALDSDFDRVTNEITLPVVPQNGFTNLSAGLVRLPTLTATDVTVTIGETKNTTATLRDYLGISMPDDSYNLDFTAAADTTIATVDAGTIIVNGTAATTRKTHSVQGDKVGTTTAKVSVTNRLGDTVETSYTITVTTSYKDCTVTKAWDDDNNSESTRPSNVTLQLQRSVVGGTLENVGSPVTVRDNGAGVWSHTFTHLPDYANNGDAYIYSISETPVPNYVKTETTGEDGSITVTNTLQHIDVSGTKTWVKMIGTATTPASITLHLCRDGERMTPEDDYKLVVTNAGADLEDENKWYYTFEDLNLLEFNPATGAKYVYSVEEDSLITNYNYSTVLNGMDVTNSFPAIITYSVTKVWDHGDLPAEKQPTSATISLYRDGALFTGETTCDGQITLDATTGWDYDFKVTDADAKGHSFQIVEDATPGYTTDVGTLVIDEADPTHGSCSVTNTYVPTPVTIAPQVTKAINGTLPAGATVRDFYFTIAKATGTPADTPMPVSATATAAGASVAGFGNITYTKAGTYTYTIRETDSGYTGYTFDTTEYTLTVTVEDAAGDGILTATQEFKEAGGAGASSLTITNEYTPLPTTYMIPVTKVISGDFPVLTDTFEFTLTASTAGAPMPDTGGEKTQITGNGTADFGSITFTAPGTYVYEVTETVPADDDKVDGYTYNDTAVNVTCTVTDENGQLKVTATKVNDDSAITAASIDNVFTTPVIAVSGRKTWVGTFAGGKPDVTINLWQNVANPSSTDTPYDTYTIVNGGTSYEFNDLPKYDESGTAYTYTVTEAPTAGVRSTAVANTTNGMDFTNTEITPGRILLEITKTVAGHILPTAKAFTFELSRTDTGSAEAVILPAQTSITTDEIRFGDAAAISFGDILFNEVGIYTFSVSENVTEFPGMTFAEAQTITVKVTETRGVLTAVLVKSATDDTQVGGELAFTNTYNPQSVAAADPPVQKIVEGDFETDTDETFTFVLTPISYTAPDGWTNAMTAAQMPKPENTELTITGAASKEFGSYNYTMAGTYVYTITEKAGTNPDYTYDDSVYTYTDVVTDDNGTLKCTRTMTKEGVAPNPTTAVFTNTYMQPMGELVVSKTVTGGGNVNTLFTFHFTFSEATRYDCEMSNGTTGTVATGESLQLKHGESVIIHIHQGVEYAVVEDAVNQYQPTPTDRTFLGTIGAGESRADYVNRYVSPGGGGGDYDSDPTGNLVIRKNVTGELGDKSKEFTFTVTFDNNGSYRYIGAESGTLHSGDTVRLAHGESITVLNLPAGTRYSVTESDNRDYIVFASDSTGIIYGNRDVTAAFTNSFSQDAVPHTGADDSVQIGFLLMGVSLMGAAGLVCFDWFTRRRRRERKSAR